MTSIYDECSSVNVFNRKTDIIKKLTFTCSVCKNPSLRNGGLKYHCIDCFVKLKNEDDSKCKSIQYNTCKSNGIKINNLRGYQVFILPGEPGFKEDPNGGIKFHDYCPTCTDDWNRRGNWNKSRNLSDNWNNSSDNWDSKLKVDLEKSNAKIKELLERIIHLEEDKHDLKDDLERSNNKNNALENKCDDLTTKLIDLLENQAKK
jgi:hypothetical protein